MNLEPGRVYRATIQGVPDQLLIVDRSAFKPVSSVDAVDNDYSHDLPEITDARPLIVLDLGGNDLDSWISMRSDLIAALRAARDAAFPKSRYPADLLSIVADQVEVQMPEMPRMSEPGMWGVVEASSIGNKFRCRWVRVSACSWQPIVIPLSLPGEWDRLVDPTLIREGLQ